MATTRRFLLAAWISIHAAVAVDGLPSGMQPTAPTVSDDKSLAEFSHSGTKFGVQQGGESERMLYIQVERRAQAHQLAIQQSKDPAFVPNWSFAAVPRPVSDGADPRAVEIAFSHPALPGMRNLLQFLISMPVDSGMVPSLMYSDQYVPFEAGFEIWRDQWLGSAENKVREVLQVTARDDSYTAMLKYIQAPEQGTSAPHDRWTLLGSVDIVYSHDLTQFTPAVLVESAYNPETSVWAHKYSDAVTTEYIIIDRGSKEILSCGFDVPKRATADAVSMYDERVKTASAKVNEYLRSMTTN